MTRDSLMRFIKNIVLFGLVGLVVALAITGLASVAPIVFGWLTAPFWVLPAIANLGAHDVGWPIALLSGTICYGVLAFSVFHLRKRRLEAARRR
jgi:hypothetical protein